MLLASGGSRKYLSCVRIRLDLEPRAIVIEQVSITTRVKVLQGSSLDTPGDHVSSNLFVFLLSWEV